MELIDLYRQMARARAFELAVAELWNRGLISGEMHLGTGEEAIAAGVLSQLGPGDALALDHRSTPMLTVLGVDPVKLLEEMLGHEDGLCRGRGGHMHLFSPEHLAASSGIVGAAGPLGAGFALAARMLRPKTAAVCFFGDGAANQGMVLESMNLAVAWALPLLFVCKDNRWAVSTRSESVTGGNLIDRARGFGLRAQAVDGLDVQAVARVTGELLGQVRKGKAAFLLATCSRLDGHFLGDLLIRLANKPMAEGKALFGNAVSAALSRGGGSIGARSAGMLKTMNTLRLARKDKKDGAGDPLAQARKALKKHRDQVRRIDDEARTEMARAVDAALTGGGQ